MMNQIKHGLFFIIGAIYTSAWWIISIYGVGNDALNSSQLGKIVVPSFITVVIGSILIFVGVLYWLATNWNKNI